MHIAKSIAFVFLFFFFSGFSQNTPLTAEEAQKFKTEVAQKTQTYQSLSGEFEQKKHFEFMSEEVVSNGKFYFLAPDEPAHRQGRLKWEYLKPFQYGMVFNGGKLYVINEGEKSEFTISDNELFAKLNELIAGSINGKMLSSPDFKSEYFKNEDYFIAKLVPIDPVFSDVLDEIWLFFNPLNYTVHHVKIIAPSGDFLEIEFKNIEVNTPIDTSIFNK